MFACPLCSAEVELVAAVEGRTWPCPACRRFVRWGPPAPRPRRRLPLTGLLLAALASTALALACLAP